MLRIDAMRCIAKMYGISKLDWNYQQTKQMVEIENPLK